MQISAQYRQVKVLVILMSNNVQLMCSKYNKHSTTRKESTEVHSIHTSGVSIVCVRSEQDSMIWQDVTYNMM